MLSRFLAVTAAVNKMVAGSFYVEDNTYFYYWFPTQAPVFIVGLVFYFIGGVRSQGSENKNCVAAWFAGFLICLVTAIYFGTGFAVSSLLAPTIVTAAFVCLILSLYGIIRRIIVIRMMIYF